MDTGLTGKTAIVTGAGSGIGLAAVHALRAEGARVITADIDDGGLATLRTSLDPDHVVRADVANPDDVARLIAAATAGGHRLDVLVNVAGVGHRATLTQTTLAQWEQTFAVNVTGTFLTCRHAIEAMLADGAGGTIVNVSSAAAIAAVENRAAYVASKAALHGLTRSITVDYGERGIRANLIAPGTVDTPWVERMLDGTPSPEQTRAQMEQRQAIGRLGTAEEIADAITFLASERAGFMHGSTMVVDGGFSAR